MQGDIERVVKERDTLTLEVSAMRGKVEVLERERVKGEDELYEKGESYESAVKEGKEWKEKFFKMQEYVQALCAERITRT